MPAMRVESRKKERKKKKQIAPARGTIIQDKSDPASVERGCSSPFDTSSSTRCLFTFSLSAIDE